MENLSNDESSNSLFSMLCTRIWELISTTENPSNLAHLYKEYNQNTENPHIDAPIKLQSLYEKHKACLDESLTQKGFDIEIETKIMEEFINTNSLTYDNFNPLIGYLLSSSSDHKNYSVNKLNNSGYSGAEISLIIEEAKDKVLGVAKTFECPTQNDLVNKCRELSSSLIALGLNPHPELIKMARIQSAGYQKTNKTTKFGIFIEHAPGKSLKDHLQRYLREDNLSGIECALRHTAQYLSFFHEKSPLKFRNQPYELTSKKMERKIKFYKKISFLIEQILDTKNGYFNFNSSLQFLQHNLMGRVDSSIDSDKIINYLVLLLKNIEQSTIPIDWTITHGDAHVGNLFYEFKNTSYTDPLRFVTMIDFDTMKETYGAIGDRAEDIGRFLGSLWEEGAVYCANQLNNQHGGLFEEELKEKILNTYNITSKWQNIFIDTYVRETIFLKIDKKLPENIIEIILKNNSLHISSNLKGLTCLSCANKLVYNNYYKIFATSLGAMKNLELYKLCLYKTIFMNDKATKHTKQFLLYFFLREANIISK